MSISSDSLRDSGGVRGHEVAEELVCLSSYGAEKYSHHLLVGDVISSEEQMNAFDIRCNGVGVGVEFLQLAKGRHCDPQSSLPM